MANNDLEITYLSQSCFFLKYGNHGLLIDPGKKENGERTEGELVYITHKHSDHTKGVIPFLESNKRSKIVCNEQVAENFTKYKNRMIIARPNETIDLDPWHLRFIEGKHGVFKSIFNLGIIIKVGNYYFGHVGDTINYKGFYEEKLDSIAIPISGLVTTSPGQAINELKNFKKPLPKIIPMHWLFRNPFSFCKKLKEDFPDVTCEVPKDYQIIEI